MICGRMVIERQFRHLLRRRLHEPWLGESHGDTPEARHRLDVACTASVDDIHALAAIDDQRSHAEMFQCTGVAVEVVIDIARFQQVVILICVLTLPRTPCGWKAASLSIREDDATNSIKRSKKSLNWLLALCVALFHCMMHHKTLLRRLECTKPMADEQPMMLLTGASQGIGHATVKLFQEQGWGVLTVSHTPLSQRCAWAPTKRDSY